MSRHTIVLDFAAMYPSIIIAHNLCYTTHVGRTPHPNTFQAIDGHAFVQASTTKGVIPEILEYLLQQRKLAKVALAKETDPVLKIVLKALELGCKVTCNGIYGACGSEDFIVPFKILAETVTAVGRDDIKTVQDITLNLFSVKNGYRDAPEIICGDTVTWFSLCAYSGNDLGYITQTVAV